MPSRRKSGLATRPSRRWCTAWRPRRYCAACAKWATSICSCRLFRATRHNAGWWLVDELAARGHGSWRNDAKQHTDLARVIVAMFGGQSRPVVAHLIGAGKLTLEDVEYAEKTLKAIKKGEKA